MPLLHGQFYVIFLTINFYAANKMAREKDMKVISD